MLFGPWLLLLAVCSVRAQQWQQSYSSFSSQGAPSPPGGQGPHPGVTLSPQLMSVVCNATVPINVKQQALNSWLSTQNSTIKISQVKQAEAEHDKKVQQTVTGLSNAAQSAYSNIQSIQKDYSLSDQQQRDKERNLVDGLSQSVRQELMQARVIPGPPPPMPGGQQGGPPGPGAAMSSQGGTDAGPPPPPPPLTVFDFVCGPPPGGPPDQNQQQ